MIVARALLPSQLFFFFSQGVRRRSHKRRASHLINFKLRRRRRVEWRSSGRRFCSFKSAPIFGQLFWRVLTEERKKKFERTFFFCSRRLLIDSEAIDAAAALVRVCERTFKGHVDDRRARRTRVALRARIVRREREQQTRATPHRFFFLLLPPQSFSPPLYRNIDALKFFAVAAAGSPARSRHARSRHARSRHAR